MHGDCIRRAAALKEANFYSDIVAAGAASGLQFCLDAGSALSYPGSGQVWYDLSGNGQDFAGQSTCTMAGSAGELSSSEYWAPDGSDYWLYDSANEAWMVAMHKDNALWSIMAICYLATFAGSDDTIFATHVANDQTGLAYHGETGNNDMALKVQNGASTAKSLRADTNVGYSAWHMLGLSMDEAGGAVSFWHKDGAYDQIGSADTWDAAYSSPSSDAPSGTFCIGAKSGGSNIIASGSRIACIAGWSTALSKAQMDTISAGRAAGRFGL